MRKRILGSALALTAAVFLPATVLSSTTASAEPITAKASPVGEFVSSAPLAWGINDPNCVATSPVSEPVILIHGTSDNADRWEQVVPVLKDAGMCVWAFDYGAEDASVQNAIPTLKAIGDLEQSAQEVAAQIDYVRDVTGSEKVNLVGHSQGGVHTKAYQQVYGSADNVARVVTVAGNLHGTDLNGKVDALGKVVEVSPEVAAFIAGTSGVQQLVGSEFMNKYNALPDTVAGVQYTAIYSAGDKTVTPNSASMMTAVPGADVVNMDLQQVCGAAPSHQRILKNKAAISQILWALTRKAGEQPNPASCAASDNSSLGSIEEKLPF